MIYRTRPSFPVFAIGPIPEDYGYSSTSISAQHLELETCPPWIPQDSRRFFAVRYLYWIGTIHSRFDRNERFP